MAEPIRTTVDGAVATVTLSKSPHNLIDGALIDDLIDAFDAAAVGGARAILLNSDLKHFCAGADVDGLGGSSGRQRPAADVLGRLEGVPIPTIAAVNGLALGGGFELALACDFIVAGSSARLGLVETTLGLAPLLGGVQRVVDRAGIARGKEIAMFGRRHDPAALERWGIVNLVVDDHELGGASMSFARQLAAGPTVANGAIKRLAAITVRDGVVAADEAQEREVEPVWASDDLATGFRAFAETGPGTAIFEGR